MYIHIMLGSPKMIKYRIYSMLFYKTIDGKWCYKMYRNV